jgi:hypothetical protein
MKVWRLPKIKGSSLKYRVPPLWPTTYIVERRTTFAKAYGIKARCYGEHVGEHIGNLGNILGTHWVGTYWELGKNELKRKIKSRHFECMLSLPIGCMKFLCSKTVGHHFWPGLIPPIVN